MIGTRAPSTIPAASALARKAKLLRQHVAGFEIGHEKNIGPAGDGRDDVLGRRGLLADGVVEGQWPIEQCRR